VSFTTRMRARRLPYLSGELFNGAHRNEGWSRFPTQRGELAYRRGLQRASS